MESKKIVYGSTSDFLKYVSDRTKDKRKTTSHNKPNKTEYDRRKSDNQFS